MVNTVVAILLLPPPEPQQGHQQTSYPGKLLIEAA
jgi:hypothetical protein